MTRIETFEGFEAAGYDLTGWTEVVDAGGSIDEDFAAPASLNKRPSAQCLKIVNTAGNGSTLGASYVHRAVTPASATYLSMLVSLDAHSLGVSDFVKSIILLDAAGTVVLMTGRWIRVGGILFYQVLAFGVDGVAGVQMIAAPVVIQTPYVVEFRIDTISQVYGVRWSLGFEVTAQVTEPTQRGVPLGYLILGNDSRTAPGPGVNAATQLYGNVAIGGPEYIGAVLPYAGRGAGEV